MFYATVYDSVQGIDGFFEFEDESSLKNFIKWTKYFYRYTNFKNWNEHCTTLIDEPATAISENEIQGVKPFRIEDELEPENWMHVFEDNDVFSANSYLEEIIEGFIQLNSE